MNNIIGGIPKEVQWIELQFTDLAGYLRSVTVASREIDEKAIKQGLSLLDGSSVEGFTSIDESDLRLKPVLETFAVIPWRDRSGRVVAEIYDRSGRYAKDPRYIAERAVKYLDSLGMKAYFGPEVEFMLLSKVYFDVASPVTGLCYKVESLEYPPSANGSGFQRIKKAYHTPEPFNRVYPVLIEIADTLEKYFGFRIESMHHEVAALGQVEIGFRFGELVETADRVITLKYVARNIAAKYGLWAVFMPKPVAGDNGNGMHTHISLWSNEHNLFYDPDDDYAQLSQTARYFIGGIIEHGRALAAIVAPTVNSYKRLVPGYEAPVYLVWSKANRSAAIRIPSYGVEGEKEKRIEFRSPDPSANPYLAFAAILAAGLDGIKKKIDPGDPVDKNVYTMSEEEKKRLGIKELPRSLDEALDELESDNDFLKPIFTKEVIEGFVEQKRQESREINSYPSPIEVYTYFTI
ncbi:type I glutamate--ammonia ligase [Pyrofollis japonicus]|uniref:type I glutamate--ammonia ligase n=1 Tax=Pyrofollis japonicus TaxID=3060460 RepID=UPI00295C2CDF|nr:type I glutamate--ammonia ligase [Pyrofollis japonicus]BEP17566.1 type I glutamate--ammonia ligase [Pyrofollis japonicus]